MYFLKLNYFSWLCLFITMFSIYLGLNSLTWLSMWMSMEMSLMSFIPRLIMNKSISESYSSLKYFIFQCLGSIFFYSSILSFFFNYLNLFGLILKLGIFPTHFWTLMVSKGLNWTIFFY